MRWRPPPSTLAASVLLLACGDASSGRDTSGLGMLTSASAGASSTSTGDASDSDASSGEASTSGGGSSAGSTGEPTSGEPTSTAGTTTDGVPPALACTYRASDYGQGLRLLDVDKGSTETLSFTIPGLPDPALVVEATLRFRGVDLDHPGEEGLVIVNDSAPIDLPADVALDNVEEEFIVAVDGRTVAGTNTAVFAAGSFDGGTYYQIGDVSLDLVARVDDCEAPADDPDPNPNDPDAKEVILDYHEATFTKRHNWVDRCDFNGGYAFTAKGAEHVDSDCEGLYAPDGTRQGKAIFTFTDLPFATYEIGVTSRHTENRNPKGALVVVDGDGKRIKQNDAKDFVEDVWGTKALAGTIEVVLDSTMEDASDSVIAVRLTPI